MTKIEIMTEVRNDGHAHYEAFGGMVLLNSQDIPWDCKEGDRLRVTIEKVKDAPEPVEVDRVAELEKKVKHLEEGLTALMSADTTLSNRINTGADFYRTLKQDFDQFIEWRNRTFKVENGYPL